MVELTVQDLKDAHGIVEEHYQFKYYERGVLNSGRLEQIVERPNWILYGHEIYPDVYSKCASLIDAVAKWHAFRNGNKRTALITARVYMVKNGYDIVIPLQSVKYSVIIANDKEDRIGVNRIAKWVRMLSSVASADRREHSAKLDEYLIKPVEMVANLFESNQDKKADSILEDWLAYKTYPEYRTERLKTLTFLHNIAKRNILETKR
jgi:death on curing protein